MTPHPKPRRRRDSRDQGRLDFNARPQPPRSDLDREVAEFVNETRREPLPGQREMEFRKP